MEMIPIVSAAEGVYSIYNTHGLSSSSGTHDLYGAAYGASTKTTRGDYRGGVDPVEAAKRLLHMMYVSPASP